jgi:hypothetical protein
MKRAAIFERIEINALSISDLDFVPNNNGASFVNGMYSHFHRS